MVQIQVLNEYYYFNKLQCTINALKRLHHYKSKLLIVEIKEQLFKFFFLKICFSILFATKVLSILIHYAAESIERKEEGGQIDSDKDPIKDVRQTPLNLPAAFEWFDCNIDDEKEVR